jgi:hypothetical protein
MADIPKEIKQGPWASTEQRHLKRDFHYNIATTDILGRFDYL